MPLFWKRPVNPEREQVLKEAINRAKIANLKSALAVRTATDRLARVAQAYKELGEKL